ncbi:protein RIC1-like [Tropilaelaps mercedesae]|uniref:Protein RIC1 homolog n=1 Tax=Tropilaelaps mercedesae TaxID=418985 RepID=A0A1V9XP14_9ACAR|nr:protein RIC1-like [Tropilaelaps mercedesae]
MYFPVRWPRYLALEGPVIQICADYHRKLFAVLQPDCIVIWMEKHPLPLWSHRRSPASLSAFGPNSRVVWRRDSSALVIVTGQNHMFFYQVEADGFHLNPVYEQKDQNGQYKRDSSELYIKDKVYPIIVSPGGECNLHGNISALLSFRDELLVAQKDGRILRLAWDGQIQDELTIDLKEVKFASEVYTWRSSFTNETYEVVDVQYLPLIGSLSMVFANGRAGVIMAMTNRFSPGEIRGVWIMDVTKATCTAVNHRYRLIAYGLSDSEGVVYYLDEVTVTFVLSHKLMLSDKDFPDVNKVAGAVKCVQWTPDNTAVAVAWENCGLAVWSVFGSLIFCSLNWESPYCRIQIRAMEWGFDGYNLWLGSDKDDICLLGFMKAAATLNPAPQCDQQKILLQGATSVLISSKDALAKTSNEPGSPWTGPSLENHSANKHWIHVPIPNTYLGLNGPVRYSCIDRDGSNLCVAGKYGLCIYSLQSKKWKFFGNETQEQDFIIAGGLLWWSEYIVCGCVNLKDPSDEIRMYPRDEKLDNSNAYIQKCDAQVLHLSTCEDKMLAFMSDSHICIYLMQRLSSPSGAGIQLVRLENIDVSSLLPHCLCVISATLTNLSVSTIPAYIQKRPESILLNVCGRLYLLQQDVFAAARRPSVAPPSAELGECAYSNPIVLASSVENMWISCTSNPKMPHLTQALYIACGAAGMQIWLPLFPAADKQHNFMSKRIMLAIKIHIYPLAVLFNEVIVLGAENDVSIQSLFPRFPHCVVSKSSQVYLHPIINKLLVRNLGSHAWQIANSCSHLPYFNHSLELLLHEVLEEEANSSNPIPDALLPRVIDFIREFPVFLTTVVQCARKTELALWPHLFAAVGNPKDLFQECILQGQLETATSYLLVLQNLEVALVSRQHATILLGSALDAGKWQLAKDIIRFLKAIDPADVESPPRASLMPSLLPASKGAKGGPGSSVVPVKPDEDITLMMASMMGPPQSQSSRQRLSSKSDISSTEHKAPNAQPKLATNTSRDDSDVMNEAFIDVILMSFARKLLQVGQLRKFGHLLAYLEFPLAAFLAKERAKAAKVDDYPLALKNLHRDFEFPYPSYVPPSDASSASNESPMSSHSGVVTLMFNGGGQAARSSSMASDSGITSIDVSLQTPSPADGDVDIATTRKQNQGPATATGRNPDVGATGQLKGDSGELLGGQVHAVRNAECDSLCGSEAGSWQLEQQDAASMIAGHMCGVSGNSSPSNTDNRKFGAGDGGWSSGRASERELAKRQLVHVSEILTIHECHDWALLCAVILNQPATVVRYALRSTVHRQAVQTLDHWAHKECAGYRPLFQSIFAQINRNLKQSLQLPPLLKSTDLPHGPTNVLVERETVVNGGPVSVGTVAVPETPPKQRPPSADSNASDLAKEDSFDVNRCKLQQLDHEEEVRLEATTGLSHSLSQPNLSPRRTLADCEMPQNLARSVENFRQDSDQDDSDGGCVVQ